MSIFSGFGLWNFFCLKVRSKTLQYDKAYSLIFCESDYFWKSYGSFKLDFYFLSNLIVNPPCVLQQGERLRLFRASSYETLHKGKGIIWRCAWRNIIIGQRLEREIIRLRLFGQLGGGGYRFCELAHSISSSCETFTKWTPWQFLHGLFQQ